MLVEVEEVELRPEAPVVLCACLLQPVEVRVEVRLRVERGAVDPRQLRVPLVSSPVGPCETGQPQRLDGRRVLEVRAAAEIGEVALRVQRDGRLGLARELDLVGLGLRAEALERVLAWDLLATPGAPLLYLAPHLGFDRGEILLRDRLRELEVVVEAVGDRRPDRDLGSGVEPEHGLGEQVRGRVPQDVEGVRIVLVPYRHKLDSFAAAERKTKVLDMPVDTSEDGVACQLRPDRPCRVESARTVGQLELGRIGQHDLHRAGG